MENQPRKLYRSLQDRQLGGVCGGLGEYLNVDSTIIRIVAIAGFFMTGTLLLWAYLAMWLLTPEKSMA